jgi:hypothetical protein
MPTIKIHAITKDGKETEQTFVLSELNAVIHEFLLSDKYQLIETYLEGSKTPSSRLASEPAPESTLIVISFINGEIIKDAFLRAKAAQEDNYLIIYSLSDLTHKKIVAIYNPSTWLYTKYE